MGIFKNSAILAGLMLLLGIGLGLVNRKTEEKIVYKERIVEVEKKTTDTKNDINIKTKTKVIKNKDGTEITETETETVDKTTKNEENIKTSDKSVDIKQKTVYNTQKYLVGLSALTDRGQIKYQMDLSKQFIGPLYLGVTASDKREYGVTLKLTF